MRRRSPLTREAPRPDWIRSHPAAPWAAVVTVCLGAFMGQLDASIVTLTYPRLRAEFHTGLGSVQWVSLAYLLVLAVLLIPVGRVSDRRGRKLLYLYGFALFTASSAGCALAPSLGWLVGARAVQAVGAALLQANSVALVVSSVPRARMRTALGLQASAQALGLALGPTVGGALVQLYGWRSVFWVNVPVGVVAVTAGWFLLPRSRQLSRDRGGDPTGLVLLATAAVAGLLMLTALSGWAVPPWLTGSLAVMALASAAVFVVVELRVRQPLVDLRALRRQRLVRPLAGALFAYLVLFAPLVLFPTVFERWQVSTAQGGLVLSCLPAGFGLGAVAGNALPRRLTNLARIRTGGLAAAAFLAAGAAAWASPLATAALLFAVGGCLGLAIPANNTVVMAAVPPSAAAATGGMLNVARTFGTALGVALSVAGVHVATTHDVPAAPLVLGMLSVCAIAVALTATGQRGRPGGEELPGALSGPGGAGLPPPA